MKVLVSTDAVGGVWTHSLDLARGLAQQGVQVTLAVMGPSPSPEMEQEALRIPGLRLEARPYRLEWMDDPWEDVQAAGDWLLGLEKTHRVDLVHSNSYSHGALDFRSPVVIGAHSSIHGWWDAVHGDDPPGKKWRVYQEKVHEGIEGADLIVAPTAWMLRSLKRHYGPITTPMRTIRNGRSPFTEPDHKEDLALWVGRVWDEAKNVKLLDQAAARGVPWRTRVIGDDQHPENQGKVRLRHVEQSGRVGADELRQAYARAGVFVSTAHYEPFGLGPLEAAQAGCALVLPRIGSLQETWEDDALYYKEDDPAELHHLLHELALDPDLHIRHCERARQRAQDLTHQKMAADYHAAYRRRIDRSSATRPATQTPGPGARPVGAATPSHDGPRPTSPPAAAGAPAHSEMTRARRPTRRPLEDPGRVSSPRPLPANPFRSSPTMLPSDAALPAARTRGAGPYRTDISRSAYTPEPLRVPAPPTRTRIPGTGRQTRDGRPTSDHTTSPRATPATTSPTQDPTPDPRPDSRPETGPDPRPRRIKHDPEVEASAS